MSDFSSEDFVEVVAQSCRNFSSGRTASNRYSAITEGLSCRACKNWDGSGCMINSFESELNKIGQ